MASWTEEAGLQTVEKTISHGAQAPLFPLPRGQQPWHAAAWVRLAATRRLENGEVKWPCRKEVLTKPVSSPRDVSVREHSLHDVTHRTH